MQEFVVMRDIQFSHQSLLSRECSLATVAGDVRICKEFVGFCAQQKENQENGKILLQDWKQMLLKSGLQPATINTKLAAVNGFFRFLGHPEYCVRQVRCQRRVFREKDRDLSRAEYLRLVRAAYAQGKIRLCLAMQTICATGVRVSKLRFITVKAVYTGHATVTGKGECREILLPGTLCKKLKRYLKQLHRWPSGKVIGENSIFSESVFLTAGGKPLDRSNLWGEMRSLCQAAGVSSHKVFPHNLRHLFAKAFYALDKDIGKLADLLGHASIETTRIYIMETGLTHARLLDRLHLLL